MVNREELKNNISVVLPIVTEGILVVDNKIATISHIDKANAATVFTTFTIPFADGIYGVDFKKLYSLLVAYNTKEIDIKTTSNYITMRSGSQNNKVALLNTDTLQAIRNKSETPLPCIVEVNTEEIVDVIDFIDKIESSSKNDIVNVSLSFDGNNLSVLCPVAEDTDKTFDISYVEKGKGEKFKSTFSFMYLKDIVKAISKVNPKGKIKISIGNKSPCRIESNNVMYVIADVMEDE